MTPTVAADLYWILPGPRDFVRRVARAAQESRMLFINLPKRTVPGTWQHVLLGLKDAHIDSPKEITVTAGNDIAAEIGVHLGVDRMSPDRLASFQHAERTAFVLRPDGSDAAQQNADSYAGDYMKADPDDQGNIVLVTSICNDDLLKDNVVEGLQIIVFDGGLTTDEMEAYVNLRMLNEPGLGSTRLTRAVVCEFASFDVTFAETLISQDPSRLVSIQEFLPEIASQYGDRGRSRSWAEGMTSIRQPEVTHVLHEYHLARHGAELQRTLTEKRIQSRYWRAAVKTMTPWLEERRDRVLSFLKTEINRIAAKNGGVIKIPKTNGQMRDVAPEALEYNNIIGLNRSNDLVLTTPMERAAYDVCRAAVDVRNEIAHLRPPHVADVQVLVRRMDALLKD